MAAQNNQQSPSDFISSAARWILGIAAGWFILLALQGFFSARGIGPSWLRFDYELSGRFGDSFGPLNTVMAAIAAIAAIAAYRSQSVELRETRLREVAAQASADRRDFENTFFRLIELVREAVNETCVHDPRVGKDFEGRRAFELILRRVGASAGNDNEDRSKWKKIYFQHQSQLGHYFRLVYQVLRFINDSDVKDKALYARIFRATLGNPEIVLLALNGWHGGYPKTKRLIRMYSMLHNITAGEAVSRRFHVAYKKPAFGDRDVVAENKHSVNTTE